MHWVPPEGTFTPRRSTPSRQPRVPGDSGVRKLRRPHRATVAGDSDGVNFTENWTASMRGRLRQDAGDHRGGRGQLFGLYATCRPTSRSGSRRS